MKIIDLKNTRKLDILSTETCLLLRIMISHLYYNIPDCLSLKKIKCSIRETMEEKRRNTFTPQGKINWLINLSLFLKQRSALIIRHN